MKDTQEFINCPACGKKMQKIVLDSQEFFVDVCLEGCGGIWLDNRELDKVNEVSENIGALEEVLKGKEFNSVDSTAPRYCPICNLPMVKNYASAKQEIEIDECYTCGGKFLDNKELHLMRRQYASELDRTKDVLNLAEDTEKLKEFFIRVLEKDNYEINERESFEK